VSRPEAKQTKKTIEKAKELIQKGYKTFPLQPLFILIFGTKIDQAAVLLLLLTVKKNPTILS
jgi:hypothetical protein